MKTRFYKRAIGLLATASLFSVACFAQAAPVVDVLVLYTDAAQNTHSGRDMDARIGSYIAYSNQAFANSGVDMRFRLVGSQKVDLDYTYVTEENLTALRTNSEVAKLRQQYGADLVTLLNLRQPMSGGYVCGIGYVPPGDGGTGRLSSYASSVAFSLVGVDCGLSTFTHELGHNMSLGHSYAQDSKGGVWAWGRGHGVQSLFSTLMAYPHYYGTRNQLQQFSNPNQRSCSGQSCGVPQGEREEADASANLNRLGAQIAAFMPEIVETDGVGENEPELPECEQDDVANNLIRNGSFNSLDGWQTIFNVSKLGQIAIKSQCVNQVLSVSNRTRLYGDAYYDLTGQLLAGKDYSLSAKFGIANADRDAVRVALRIQENGRTRYQYLSPISVTSHELTEYSEHFRLDAATQPDSVGLLFYGPQINTDMLVDDVVLVEGLGEAPAISGPVLHDRFEKTAIGWSSYGGSNTVFSSNASEGSNSLRNYSRDYSHSGPIREATGIFAPNTRYNVSVSLFVQDESSASSTARVWIYYVDDQGGHWLQAVDTSISTNTWQKVDGNFSIDAIGAVTQVRLLVGGPRPFVDMYVDDLTVVPE